MKSEEKGKEKCERVSALCSFFSSAPFFPSFPAALHVHSNIPARAYAHARAAVGRVKGGDGHVAFIDCRKVTTIVLADV